MKPVRPRTFEKLPKEARRLLEDAMKDDGNAGYDRKAVRLFDKLADMMQRSDSAEIRTDSHAMRANASLLRSQMKLGRDLEEADELLTEATQRLEKALDPDRHWADYVFLLNHIRSAQHKEIGCKIIRDRNGKWEVRCFAVSNALGIPGISRGEKFDLECSICGRDPMFCSHVAGQVYNGRLAHQMVRNLEIEEISIMINQIPADRHSIGILPRPLTDEDIRKFFNKGRARQILLGGKMRCGDLIRVINQMRLGGADFVLPTRKRYVG